MSARLDDTNPVSNADWLLTIEGVNAYFSKFSGGAVAVERPKFSDGLTSVERTAATGTVKVSNITLEKAYDPVKDRELIRSVIDWQCSPEYRTVTLTPVQRCNGVEQLSEADPVVYVNCRLANSTIPGSIDTGSGSEVSMIVLEFTAEQRVINRSA